MTAIPTENEINIEYLIEKLESTEINSNPGSVAICISIICEILRKQQNLPTEVY